MASHTSPMDPAGGSAAEILTEDEWDMHPSSMRSSGQSSAQSRKPKKEGKWDRAISKLHQVSKDLTQKLDLLHDRVDEMKGSSEEDAGKTHAAIVDLKETVDELRGAVKQAESQVAQGDMTTHGARAIPWAWLGVALALCCSMAAFAWDRWHDDGGVEAARVLVQGHVLQIWQRVEAFEVRMAKLEAVAGLRAHYHVDGPAVLAGGTQHFPRPIGIDLVMTLIFVILSGLLYARSEFIAKRLQNSVLATTDRLNSSFQDLQTAVAAKADADLATNAAFQELRSTVAASEQRMAGKVDAAQVRAIVMNKATHEYGARVTSGKVLGARDGGMLSGGSHAHTETNGYAAARHPAPLIVEWDNPPLVSHVAFRLLDKNDNTYTYSLWFQGSDGVWHTVCEDQAGKGWQRFALMGEFRHGKSTKVRAFKWVGTNTVNEEVHVVDLEVV
mmetsp:Transcript_95789/g.292923  ORF Transcript_95789/g.292923 Transcript_95789/m.292923 type:complete len:443 (-) Transcript_95789:462-1790(-)